MKKMNLIGKSILVALLGTLGMASAQAATVSGRADAWVFQAVTVTESTSMSFGNIVPDLAASTNVTVDTADGISSDNPSTTLLGTPASGAFQITGQTGSTVTITITDTGDLGGLVFVPNTTSSLGATHVIDAASANNIAKVGGTLTVPAAQAPGTYSNPAAYQVQVNYQ